MRLAEVEAILHEIGVHGLIPKSGKVVGSCPFAPQTHAKGTDRSPSFAVIHTHHGGWAYSCRACAEHGGLKNLIVRLSKGRAKIRALQIYYDALDLDREAEGHRSRLDYKPFADAAVTRADVPVTREGYAPGVNATRGQQLAIIGDDQDTTSRPCDEDLSRFAPGPVDYLTVKRGFDAETQAAFGILDDRSQYRAVFPIKDWDGALLGVTKRLYWEHDFCFSCREDIGDGEGGLEHRCSGCGRLFVKYLHTKGMNRNEILYGEWLYEEGAVPVLVEGTTDAMRLWQYGVRPAGGFWAGAILGAYPGEMQVVRLVRRTGARRVFVVRDNDAPTLDHPDGAGAELAPRLRELDPGMEVCEIVTSAKDPGSMSEAQVAALLQVMSNLLQETGPLPRQVTI
ncbi:hypothetical protein UFOVP1382_198 [uncultured Caudovirales phage]|uniref:Uncharacterized protein n=1 Tax=uncultured Caudovirales phage TaxID=2100421 RepID=A0A6J5S5D7_9CAUD|nr:hypothetical protein UFOVP1382_198 [uncultured Caudovirales phage]